VWYPEQVRPILPIALSSAFLFFVSLPFDVSHFENVDHSAAFVLGLGWMGPLAFQFGWFANPILFVGWFVLVIAQRRSMQKINAGFLGFASLLALSCFVSLPLGSMSGPHEGELARGFQGFGLAIVLWTLSILVAFAGAVFQLVSKPLPDKGRPLSMDRPQR